MKLNTLFFLKAMSICTTFIFMSCSPLSSQTKVDGSSDNSSLASNTAGLDAFTSGYYAFVKSQGCIKCHQDKISPNIGAADVNTAYQSAKLLLDVTSPNASVLIDYAGNSHCGDVACSNTSAKAVAQSNIDAWAAAELAASAPTNTAPTTASFKYQTAALKVPATIPTITSATPAVMRFDLSQLKPAVAGLQNAILEIEIQYVNTNIYRINKPKIVGATTALVYTDIGVYMKQSSDPSVLGAEDLTYTSNWHDLIKQPALVAKPATLPTGPLPATTVTPLIDLPLYYVTTTGADYFTLTFGNIAPP
ncbi:MAG: hypothetical protein ACXVAX_01515 [Pseudobdellovibrio sp.]